ncbi:MAG: hypothetical protein HYY08_00040 [Firmicutes bacterium]|nr:hypothetical protein [Bacillota bacterium]
MEELRSRTGDVILAIDPGREKCGVAVMSRNGVTLVRDVVALPDLPGRVREIVQVHEVSTIAVGNLTGSEDVKALLIGCGAAEPVRGIVLVDEHGSSREGRRRYLQDHPPRGLWKLVPQSLRVPKEPIDGYVAEVLGLRYLVQDRERYSP